MSTSTHDDTYSTRASIFLRLHADDSKRREIAWEQFQQRYAPVIAGFARNFGAGAQDVDDVIQEVMLGFFRVSPKFEYDPSRGRFRGYLKTITTNALRGRLKKAARSREVPLDDLQLDSPAAEDSWERQWQSQLLHRAIDEARQEYQDNKTFRAFERYGILNESADQVAADLGMRVDSVYKAKERVTRALRLKVQRMQEEEG